MIKRRVRKTFYLAEDHKEERVKFFKYIIENKIKTKDIFFTDETRTDTSGKNDYIRISKKNEEANNLISHQEKNIWTIDNNCGSRLTEMANGNNPVSTGVPVRTPPPLPLQTSDTPPSKYWRGWLPY